MEILKIILGSASASAVLTTIINRIFAVFDRKSHRNKVDRLVLLYIIESLSEKYVSQGFVTAKQLAAFREMYDAYKACDGDGYADILKENVESLPVVDERRKNE